MRSQQPQWLTVSDVILSASATFTFKTEEGNEKVRKRLRIIHRQLQHLPGFSFQKCFHGSNSKPMIYRITSILTFLPLRLKTLSPVNKFCYTRLTCKTLWFCSCCITPLEIQWCARKPMISEDRVSLRREKLSVRPQSEALPKNFYAQLLTDIIGYTISPADMRKRWKPVDEDRTQNQNEHYPTLRMHSIPACCRQLPWLVHLDKNQK